MKKYICPMGCIEPQERPGNCPVCGMKLIEEHKKHKEKHDDHLDKHHGHKAENFLKKFWLSLILTIPIVLYSEIFQKITGIKLPSFEGIQYIILLLGSIVFFYCGFVFILGAFREIRAKNPGMMTLIALAITSAYIYSVFAILFKIGHEFFWELTTLITIMLLGHYFEMKSISSAQKALQEIEKLLPDIVELEDGRKVRLNELKLNDIVIIRPGGKIPADGIVVEGKSEVNESMITGESKPVLKEVGSEVIAGTINGDGVLKVKVTKIGEETFLAGIKRLIKEAQASKSKLQVLADVFAKYLTFIAVSVGSLSF
ncbi:MAG: HAD-IC family P-type ATPase, partial [candidate division WOR-3 bacterium]